MSKRLFAAAGAFGCGKTTTLAYLAEHHGHRVHEEAHNQVLRVLGTRMDGHPPDQGYRPIDDPDHFCPVCRPLEFCDLVLARQAEIEAAAGDGDIVDHGWLDAVEYGCRNAGISRLPPGNRPHFPPYALVFLFATMPALQRPRWGKSAAARAAECIDINGRLGAMYRAAGMSVVDVPPGTVEWRAGLIDAAIRARRMAPMN